MGLCPVKRTKPGLPRTYGAGLPFRFNTLHAKIFRVLFVFKGTQEGYAVCATKVTKNALSKLASLPHRPLPCKADKTWAAIFLPVYPFAFRPFTQKFFVCCLFLKALKRATPFAMPCHYTGHHRFVRFRPKLIC
jgi:hypothetical protein